MIRVLPQQTQSVAQFINQIEAEYHRENDCTELLVQLEMIFSQMKKANCHRRGKNLKSERFSSIL